MYFWRIGRCSNFSDARFDKRCRTHLACSHLWPFLRTAVFSTSRPACCYTMVSHVNRRQRKGVQDSTCSINFLLTSRTVVFKCPFVLWGQYWFWYDPLMCHLFDVGRHLVSRYIPISLYCLSSFCSLFFPFPRYNNSLIALELLRSSENRYNSSCSSIGRAITYAKSYITVNILTSTYKVAIFHILQMYCKYIALYVTVSIFQYIFVS